MPKLVTIFDKATGQALQRLSIDAEECVASGSYVRSLAEVTKPEPEKSSEATGAEGAGVASAAPEPAEPPLEEEEGGDTRPSVGAWQRLIAVTRPLPSPKVSIILKRLRDLYLGNDDAPNIDAVMDGLGIETPALLTDALPDIVAQLREAAK
jgi:hypothetical protein